MQTLGPYGPSSRGCPSPARPGELLEGPLHPPVHSPPPQPEQRAAVHALQRVPFGHQVLGRAAQFFPNMTLKAQSQPLHPRGSCAPPGRPAARRLAAPDHRPTVFRLLLSVPHGMFSASSCPGDLLSPLSAVTHGALTSLTALVPQLLSQLCQCPLPASCPPEPPPPVHS